MFSPADRQHLLQELLALARSDPAVTAAAVVGSGASLGADAWSDIDLALRVGPGHSPVDVADAWAAHLRSGHEVADVLDLWSGPALYRVFLLSSSLQVDLSCWPDADFASTGEPFALQFGEAGATRATAAPDPRGVVGWAWLYALHVRSALARGRRWQALQMLEGLRDRVITLACLRYGLPGHQGRGVDRLPDAQLAALEATVVSALGAAEFAQCFTAALDLLLDEVEQVDPTLARRLRQPLAELTATAEQAAVSGAPADDGSPGGGS